MKIVIAPDSYKETLSAKDVATAIEKGFKKVFKNANFIKVPLADGGEGTVEALVDATNGSIKKVLVKDPLQRDIEAYYGILGDNKTAIIEMATSSGLELLKQDEKNPLETTTYGFGQLIKDAYEKLLNGTAVGRYLVKIDN